MKDHRMTTADAQAMIEEVLAFERGEVVTEEKGYDIEQKPGKDYWYVKRDGKKLGAISKGKNEKFDADTDTEGGGEYKAGFDTIAAAAEWLVSKDKTAKTESELTEDANRAIFDAIGRLESDLTQMKQAINQGKLEDASLIAANVVSHAGDVALYFWIVAKKQGFAGAPLKRFENYMKRFNVMKSATH